MRLPGAERGCGVGGATETNGVIPAVLRQAQDEAEAEGRDPLLDMDKEMSGSRTALRASGMTSVGGEASAAASASAVLRRDEAQRRPPSPAGSGATRWRKYSPEVWAEVEAAYLGRGEPGVVVAERHGMSLQSLYAHFPGRGKRARQAAERARAGRASILRRAQDEGGAPPQDADGGRGVGEAETKRIVRRVVVSTSTGCVAPAS